MGLIRDLFMSWKVCSVVFAVWAVNVWMRVSCQIFKSNVSSESSKPVWVGGTWWRSTQNSERNRNGQGSPHFSQPFFVPPDLWCTGLVCFVFFCMSIRVPLRNLWSRRPLWLIACTDHQGASFHFSCLPDSECPVAFSWKRRNHVISKNPNDVGHTEGLLMEEIRPTSPGMYNSRRKYR